MSLKASLSNKDDSFLNLNVFEDNGTFYNYKKVFLRVDTKE